MTLDNKIFFYIHEEVSTHYNIFIDVELSK